MPRQIAPSCWTCKVRHKRCDESRPICSVCTGLGIECEYGPERPAWMDDGPLQHAMSQKLKIQIKTKARQRRQERAIDRIRGHPHNHHESESESQSQSQSQSQSPSRSSMSPVPNSFAILASLDDQETGILTVYIDHVFSLLFPFYSPSILEGGRAWLLYTIAKSDVILEMTKGIACHVASIIPVRGHHYCSSPPTIPDECVKPAQVHVRQQAELAIIQLQQQLKHLSLASEESTPHIFSPSRYGSITEGAALFNSIVQALVFENVTADAKDDRWQLHLDAAIGWLIETIENHKQQSEPQQDHNQDQSPPWFVSLMGNLVPPSAYPQPAFPKWHPTQAAFRFYASYLITHDIISSTTLSRPPRLLDYFDDIFGSYRDDIHSPDHHQTSQHERHYPLSLSEINGCQTWVMRLIADISALDSQFQRPQQQQQDDGDIADKSDHALATLTQQAFKIDYQLQIGILRLNNEEIRAETRNDNQAGVQSHYLDPNPTHITPHSIVKITRLHLIAARAYICSVKLSAFPSDAEREESCTNCIQRAISEGSRLLRDIMACSSSSGINLAAKMKMIRPSAWPIVVLAALCGEGNTEDEREVFREVLCGRGMGALAGFGGLGRGRELLFEDTGEGEWSWRKREKGEHSLEVLRRVLLI